MIRVMSYHRLMTMNDASAEAVLFRSLADATRLAIVRRLAGGEARVIDLTRELGLAQSTVSGHLSHLRGSGLVAGRHAGRQIFYSLARPEVLQVLNSGEKVLAATIDNSDQAKRDRRKR